MIVAWRQLAIAVQLFPCRCKQLTRDDRRHFYLNPLLARASSITAVWVFRVWIAVPGLFDPSLPLDGFFLAETSAPHIGRVLQEHTDCTTPPPRIPRRRRN